MENVICKSSQYCVGMRNAIKQFSVFASPAMVVIEMGKTAIDDYK